MTQTKKKHTGLKALGILILTAIFILAIGMIMLGHIPALYQPVTPPPAGQVSPYLTHKLGPDFFEKIQLDRPFELLIEQQGVNEIFSSQCPEPESYGGFSFSAPTVAFNQDTIVLMTTIGFKKTSSVLSVTARPGMLPDGKLNLNIKSINLGALPVTKLAASLARKYADEYLVPWDKELIPIVNGVINNQPFEPVMRISGCTVRLKTFTLEQGKLILRVEPIK